MDYKYIEQLLERYWNAETTLEEENILRTFFCQKDIPAEMEPLRPPNKMHATATAHNISEAPRRRRLALIAALHMPAAMQTDEISTIATPHANTITD